MGADLEKLYSRDHTFETSVPWPYPTASNAEENTPLEAATVSESRVEPFEDDGGVSTTSVDAPELPTKEDYQILINNAEATGSGQKRKVPLLPSLSKRAAHAQVSQLLPPKTSNTQLKDGLALCGLTSAQQLNAKSKPSSHRKVVHLTEPNNHNRQLWPQAVTADPLLASTAVDLDSAIDTEDIFRIVERDLGITMSEDARAPRLECDASLFGLHGV